MLGVSVSEHAVVETPQGTSVQAGSAELALSRVAERVRLGGHDVPAAVVRRRYRAGLANFFRLYLPLADSWQLFDNSQSSGPRRVAAGEGRAVRRLDDGEIWRRLKEAFDA
jgi:predicted ABC-type ATPase